jgi:hypothetical protein
MTKSERWKPEDGEWYYFVCSNGSIDEYQWDGDGTDDIYYQNGNCFKTEAEAQAAAEKIKALLLSLHKSVTNCNQLPKLTAEVFNRPDCPEWAQYAAVDMNGVVTFFKEKPVINKYHWWSSPNYAIKEIIHGHYFDATDWRTNLIERPAKLPDWCKVGEWVWDVENSRYVKVISITDMVLLRTKSKCTYYEDLKDMTGSYKQTHRRPYKVNELKALVGKPITIPDGSVCLCTIYSKQFKSVIFDNMHWDAQKLVDSGCTIDDEPCGVLEHLNENGEWVE